MFPAASKRSTRLDSYLSGLSLGFGSGISRYLSRFVADEFDQLIIKVGWTNEWMAENIRVWEVLVLSGGGAEGIGRQKSLTPFLARATVDHSIKRETGNGNALERYYYVVPIY